jgi:hypothetical protein
MPKKDLAQYDFIVAIDKSGSMAQPGNHGLSRWKCEMDRPDYRTEFVGWVSEAQPTGTAGSLKPRKSGQQAAESLSRQPSGSALGCR